MELNKLLGQSLIWRGLYFISLLMVNVFLARYLTAPVAGWVYYLTNIFLFVQILLSLSLQSGITYFASGNIIGVNKLLWLSICWSAVVGLLVLLVSFIYFHFVKDTTLQIELMYALFAFCYVTGMLLTGYVTVLFYTQNDFFLPNFLMTLLSLALVVMIPKNSITAGAIYEDHILYLYFILFILQGISLCIAFAMKNKSFREFSLPTKNENGKLFRYSIVAVAANVIFFLVYRIDYWFVRNNPAVCTDADLGNYIQVSKLGQLLLIIPQIIASVIFPRSASGLQRDELNNTMMIMARLLSRFFLLLMIIVALSGNRLFTFVFGETFDKMFWPFLIIVPGIFSLSVLTLLSAYFSGKGNVRVNLNGAIIALVFMLVGDYFLVPLYGITAAAAVSTVSYSINVGYSLLQFYKDYSINVFEFFRWRKTDYHWLKSLLKRNN